MKWIAIRLALVAAILTFVVQPVVAQTEPPPATLEAPEAGKQPPLEAPKADNLPPMQEQQSMPIPRAQKLLDGPVKKVDSASRSVEVGWFLGLFGTTLEVTDDTHIAVAGQKGSLADIREGDRVKASYEARDGQNVAKSIEVFPAAK
jgi:Cu/Ag efflux protein CusF